jgi:hypothetical protein
MALTQQMGTKWFMHVANRAAGLRPADRGEMKYYLFFYRFVCPFERSFALRYRANAVEKSKGV